MWQNICVKFTFWLITLYDRCWNWIFTSRQNRPTVTIYKGLIHHKKETRNGICATIVNDVYKVMKRERKFKFQKDNHSSLKVMSNTWNTKMHWPGSLKIIISYGYYCSPNKLGILYQWSGDSDDQGRTWMVIASRYTVMCLGVWGRALSRW